LTSLTTTTTPTTTTAMPAPKLPSEIAGKTVEEVVLFFLQISRSYLPGKKNTTNNNKAFNPKRKKKAHQLKL
jgi:hypothetical protein